jgi:hypothetical protein
MGACVLGKGGGSERLQEGGGDVGRVVSLDVLVEMLAAVKVTGLREDVGDSDLEALLPVGDEGRAPPVQGRLGPDSCTPAAGRPTGRRGPWSSGANRARRASARS